MNEDIMKAAGFEKEVKQVKEGICPICKNHVVFDNFRDELSKREYWISGMCMSCQDLIFGK